MNNIETILMAIIEGNCEILINYLSEEEVKENRIETNLDDYKWAGNHETDARYTYPNRDRLIVVALRKLLEEIKQHGDLTSLGFLRKFSKEIEKQ